jgi:hypothetical protein
VVADLARLTRDALDRGLRAAGWKPAASGVYDRRVNRHFELVAQFWAEGEPVAVQALLSLESRRLWMVLVDLGEDGREPAVRRDPLDADPVVEREDQVEAVVAGVLARIEAAAQRLAGAYADVDAFAAALEGDEDTRADAPIVVPALLAATGRRREARERARRVPGDFAERLDGWLRGERRPPPPGSAVSIDWRRVFEKARERHAEPPEVRAQRPQASWGDVFRTGRGLVRLLREESPALPTPARDGVWQPVELRADAQPVLEAARRAAPLPIWQNAFVEARVEPGGRVMVDGVEVGTVAMRGEGATVPGKIERNRRDGPLELAVQLGEPA